MPPTDPDLSTADRADVPPLGWGLLGCGWVARDYVAPALRAAGAARLVALCDLDPDALAACAPDAEGARRTTDLDAFLADDAVEAVYVATPNDSHADLVAACAAAGKHVLCEKPMARTLPEAERMVAACQQAGVTYATAFDQRFHAAHQHIQRLVAAGDLGTVTCVRIHYACWTPGDWAPDPDRAGGGAFIDLAPHGLDLTQMLLGERLTDAQALFQRRVFDYPVDDGAVLVGRSEGGVLLSQTVAYNRPDPFPRRTLEVIGTEAQVVAQNTMGQVGGGTVTRTARDGTTTAVDVPGLDRSPFRGQVDAFTEAIRTGTPFPFPPEHDLHTMRLVAGCAEAMAA